MKFRKINRSAKAKPDSIFQTEQNVDELVQRQKLLSLYIYVYMAFTESFSNRRKHNMGFFICCRSSAHLIEKK